MQEEKQPAFGLASIQESAVEKEVGIECYISQGGPVPAVTKYLLTDFIVNEITPEEKVVMLTEKPNPVPYQQPKV